MTTVPNINTERWAPVLDLLEAHHENRGHSGPAQWCAAPECQDVLQLLAGCDPAPCSDCGQNQARVCLSCAEDYY